MRAMLFALLLVAGGAGCKKSAAPAPAAATTGSAAPIATATAAVAAAAPGGDPVPTPVGAAAPMPHKSFRASGGSDGDGDADDDNSVGDDDSSAAMDQAPPADVDVPAASAVKATTDTVYVTNLAPSVTADDVKVLFEGYGTVVDVKTNRDHINKDAAGMAQVKMADVAAAQAALDHLNNTDLQGATIKVTPAK